MPDQDHDPYLMTPVSPLRAGLGGVCPRCGQGRLFRGYLDLRDKCSCCGLDYSSFESADGPAVFIILILGFIVVGLALVVEVSFEPPLWVHVVLWGPLTLLGALALLRPFKGVMIALQYHFKAEEGRLDGEDEI
ncbi:DUF983 domain-containing protein [Luteithermobacter gelatinilyticus]|uniref:DUF983 domain-containing protein n=1 Tax=Luteithermobacter gelatinilyticus TaxID=2582913 RepID=UPI0011059AAF|nr:DUF983 domain-containing protein [Luteithermobacter gelatinilyticus]|tara:strand:- start:5485 stop:5886 length:402 start_codon:yes stop_codon:yes gene_type:complete